MFNLTKSSQQRKTARHCRTPIESCLVIVNNIIVLLLTNKCLDVCIFAHFKVNCEVMPLRSFTYFKLITSRHRKELRGTPKAWCPRPWPLRKSVTGTWVKYVGKVLSWFCKTFTSGVDLNMHGIKEHYLLSSDINDTDKFGVDMQWRLLCRHCGTVAFPIFMLYFVFRSVCNFTSVFRFVYTRSVDNVSSTHEMFCTRPILDIYLFLYGKHS